MRDEGPSPAYAERSKNPTNRVNCDFCSRCFVYNCDGSTAQHHDIHLTAGSYFLTPEELYGKTD
jgi:hypothetical protein